MAINFFRYKGKSLVEITNLEGTIILTLSEYVKGKERARKHLKQSRIMGQ